MRWRGSISSLCSFKSPHWFIFFFFFLNDPPTPEISPFPLPAALPIFPPPLGLPPRHTSAGTPQSSCDPAPTAPATTSIPHSSGTPLQPPRRPYLLKVSIQIQQIGRAHV